MQPGLRRINVKKRIDYIDFMNIAACFAVVCLHCSGSVFEFGIVEEREWFLSMFIQTVMHFAIPVFFMITGTTLLEYRQKYDTKTFFKKRASRTVLPFLFWSCFYLLLPVLLDGAAFPEFALWKEGLLNNQANNIFWFFYTIWGVYLCIPVFSLLAREENFRIFEYICLLFFGAQALFPVIARFVTPIYTEIIPNFVTGYVGYIFFGWLIYHETYDKKVRYFIYFLGICGALLMFFGTYYLSSQAGAIDTFFMEYHSIACMPMSVALMLFAKHVRWECVYRVLPVGLVRKIAGAGLGVYVLHMFFIILFQRNEMIASHSMYFMVFIPFAAYLLSLGVVLVMQHISAVRRLIP